MRAVIDEKTAMVAAIYQFETRERMVMAVFVSMVCRLDWCVRYRAPHNLLSSAIRVSLRLCGWTGNGRLRKYL